MIWPQCCVLENSPLSPRGDLPPPKYPFLAKMVLLSLYLQNRALDFDDFCTDVKDSCPGVIWPQCCVLENSRLTPWGDLPAAERPQHCVLVDL